jgi:hypothetical protein
MFDAPVRFTVATEDLVTLWLPIRYQKNVFFGQDGVCYTIFAVANIGQDLGIDNG